MQFRSCQRQIHEGHGCAVHSCRDAMRDAMQCEFFGKTNQLCVSFSKTKVQNRTGYPGENGMHGIAVQVKIRRRLGGLVQGTNGLHLTGFSLVLLYQLWLASRRPQMLSGGEGFSVCDSRMNGFVGDFVFPPGKQIRGLPTGPLKFLAPIHPSSVDQARN